MSIVGSADHFVSQSLTVMKGVSCSSAEATPTCTCNMYTVHVIQIVVFHTNNATTENQMGTLHPLEK